MDIRIRPAQAADAHAIADVLLASRKTYVAFAPLVHPDAAVRSWIRHTLVPSGGVSVAVEADRIVGMMAVTLEGNCGWIDQLYVHPSRVACGIGSALLTQGLMHLPRPVRLYTFAENQGARRFYERHGFVAIAFGDGSDNEEGQPDVLYELPD
jgi:GNAT superfamily N-acetyltransferase